MSEEPQPGCSWYPDAAPATHAASPGNGSDSDEESIGDSEWGPTPPSDFEDSADMDYDPEEELLMRSRKEARKKMRPEVRQVAAERKPPAQKIRAPSQKTRAPARARAQTARAPSQRAPARAQGGAQQRRQEALHEATENCEQEPSQSRKLKDALRKLSREHKAGSPHNNKSRKRKSSASSAGCDGPSSPALPEPSDECVQLGVTRVFEAVESSRELRAVLAMARRDDDAGAVAVAILQAFTEDVRARRVLVHRAVCREGEAPLRNHRFRGIREEEQALRSARTRRAAAEREHAAAERALAAAAAQLDGHARALQRARALLDGRAADPDRQLLEASEELEQCLKEYSDALVTPMSPI